jgi:hypothetical protein
MIGLHIARGLMAALIGAVVIQACWTAPVNNYVLDNDPLRVHFYRARDAFKTVCSCGQEVVAFEGTEPGLRAEIDGDVVYYHRGWLQHQQLVHGEDAAFVVFAHEMGHYEYAHRGGAVTGKFSHRKAVELWADNRAGCAASIAGASKAAGVSFLGAQLESVDYPDGSERAKAFAAGFETCEIQDVLRY